MSMLCNTWTGKASSRKTENENDNEKWKKEKLKNENWIFHYYVYLCTSYHYVYVCDKSMHNAYIQIKNIMPNIPLRSDFLKSKSLWYICIYIYIQIYIYIHIRMYTYSYTHCLTYLYDWISYRVKVDNCPERQDEREWWCNVIWNLN
jgi:hypothetical protein